MTRTSILLGLALLWASFAHAAVDRERLVNADKDPGNWLTHGANYAEDRHSALTQITPGNVSELGLAWYFDTNTTRGLEATPLVIDGMMFSTGTWSKVFAHDAATGELAWEYDPLVPKAWGANACCDVVNRGVAAWGDSIYVGTLDGRLVSLDRYTGAVRWDTLTIDPAKPYTITGAPRAVNGKIMIGNGGAEYGVRGYISAYDAETGELVWRFHTVPGNPDEPFESEAMRMAAQTWTGDVYWQAGGGGTVWDSMAYDPELNLLYFGVGNGSPWSRYVRSPDGGDNLFLSSIVAVDADTGAYAWHYQTTPADSWDYTATQHIVLADLDILGETRKVLMQAPKNGFFYVIDRVTGEFISAENYVPVTWASHVDPESGRPVETANADHSTEAQITTPAALGGHNWHPMAFNHQTGLVYIPAMEMVQSYSSSRNFEHRSGNHFNLGQAEPTGGMPSLPPELLAAVLKKLMRGKLMAWDPIAQQQRWQVEQSTMWNGGVLTTQTGLVFQGTGDARLVAYDASSGEKLWESPTGVGVIASPVTYEVDGVQYVAVLAGWGGAVGLMFPSRLESAAKSRLLAYKLGATATLPVKPPSLVVPQPPPIQGTSESIGRGATLYAEHCARCHGIAAGTGGILIGLRYMPASSHEIFNQIVLDGVYSGLGMVGFADVLTPDDADALHDYLVQAANDQWEAEHSYEWWKSTRAWFYEQTAGIVAWIMAP